MEQDLQHRCHELEKQCMWHEETISNLKREKEDLEQSLQFCQMEINRLRALVRDYENAK